MERQLVPALSVLNSQAEGEAIIRVLHVILNVIWQSDTVANTSVTILGFAEDVVILAEPLKALVVDFEVPDEDVKPLALKVVLTKTSVRVHADLPYKALQSVHAYSGDIDMLVNFIYPGNLVNNNSGSCKEVFR